MPSGILSGIVRTFSGTSMSILYFLIKQ